MTELQYGSTTYQVEKLPGSPLDPSGMCKYRLTGPRGARYFTMRNQKNPSMMFLVNERSFTKGTPFTWLHEKPDGTLEIVR